MSKRNMIWLAIIIVVGVVVGVVAGIGWGFLAAGITLLVSEVVERTARARRRAAGAAAPKMRDVIESRREAD